MTLGANTASSLGMAGLTSTPAQNFPTHNYLQVQSLAAPYATPKAIDMHMQAHSRQVHGHVIFIYRNMQDKEEF